MTGSHDHLIDQVPEDVLGICRRLREKGKRGWIVGGCVRDLLRGQPAKDWDIATDARPEEVVTMFRKVIPTGIQHGTVTVLVRGAPYEVTTLRGEGAYTDGRRPDSVQFVDDITADLARRDFTFNAIALDPVDGHMIDPFGGEKDFEAHVVRAVGDPAERFAEDGLRVLRAARFAATLGCVIEPDTERAMADERSHQTFRRVSAERVRDEWMKTMRADKPSTAFDVMRRTSILAITCPELMESVGVEQNRWHAYDVWGHAMACMDACKPEPVLRVAALLHDVGKPRTRAYSEKTEDYTFYEHERVGAEMAEPLLSRLRFSNEDRARIVALIRHHLICYSDEWSDAAVRRWLRRVTPELAPDLYVIGISDALGKGRDATEDIASIERLKARAIALIESGAALSAKDLAINGNDLMSELGLKPGRIIGQILERLIEVVTDDPSVNERPQLLEAAKKLAEELSVANEAPEGARDAVKEGSWTTRVGEVCVLALAVSIFAAVPTALRTTGAGGSFVEGLLVGAAVLLPLVALTLALLRAAGRGLRGIVGQSKTRVAVLLIALWIGLSVPMLSILGTLLKTSTNHRGLGGATFAVLGLGAILAAAVAAQRLVIAGQNLAARGVRPWILAAIGAAIGALPALAAASPLARAGFVDNGARSIQAAVIDGAIALVATALVASIDLSTSVARVAGTWGVPLAAIVVIGAAARIESSPSLGRAVRAGGGLAASLLGALEDWTDRDHDGVGAHFGGADCDEGDPSRRPGALEVAGDGIDQDCDGIDPPRPATADILTSKAEAPTDASTKPASLSASAASAAPPTKASAGPASPSVSKGRPDVLLITLDTVRADRTSAYGHSNATTPNIAAIAERGVLFEHAYATGSDTQRALMPVVSGRRLSATARDRREWPTIQTENDTVAERMKRAGYITAAVTSFTWLSQERGFAQGFDQFKTVYEEAHPERDVTGPLAIRAALSILKELADRAQPIFLWIHLFDAHERYLEHAGISFGKGRAALYDGEIAFVDQQIGALRDAVEKGPRGATTAWVIHGTQGEGFSEHDFTGHGGELYEEVLRIPLVVALPGGKPGRYDKGVVSTIDIAPTVLAIAGAPSEGVDGESLLPILEGDLNRARGPVYARAAKRAAVIDWPLKLLVIERKRADRLLLFDLAADPSETKDLSKDRPEDLARLLQKRTAFEPPEK